ncbi:MAG: T9SS C-terminal target domain-containing protein [Bacteroidetes bacterium]|nr:MAG: T9SS C-terminal target domain-containing protein [Bacteroidota bacterium]
MKQWITFFALVFQGGLLLLYGQTSLTLTPVKDNTLYESATGSLSNGAGDVFFAGKTNNGLIRRAVMKFDLSGIPANATITGANLILLKVQSLSGPFDVSLHPLLADWGEGTSVALSGNGGGGTASTANDATWIHTFFSGSLWSTPGGDYDASPSATLSVGANGFYTWTSPQMVSDVEAWAANPAANFGWILVGNEAIDQTAMRFASREDANTANRPRLVVTYTVPCVAPALPVVSLSTDTLCFGGGAVSLNVTGALNSATAWHVYQGSCGGTALGNNATGTFTFQPGTSTSYFVRGEGGCVTPGTCTSVSVTVLPQVRDTLSASICRGDTLRLGGEAFTTSGTYVRTFTAPNGCDSTVVLDLDVTAINTTVVQNPNLPLSFQAVTTGAVYQWLDCNKGYSPIAGETAVSFTPDSSGSYAVAITQGQCTDTSACVEAIVLGIYDRAASFPVRIFPNPAADVVTIEWDQRLPEAQIQVFDIQGAKVYEQPVLQAVSSRISLSGLPAGLYLVQISSGGRSARQLIRKQ